MILSLLLLLVALAAQVVAQSVSFAYAPAALQENVGIGTYSPGICVQVFDLSKTTQYIVNVYHYDVNAKCLRRAAASYSFSDTYCSNICPWPININATAGVWNNVFCTYEVASGASFTASNLVAQLTDNTGSVLSTATQTVTGSVAIAPMLSPIGSLITPIGSIASQTVACALGASPRTIFIINDPPEVTLTNNTLTFAPTSTLSGSEFHFLVTCVDANGLTDSQVVYAAVSSSFAKLASRDFAAPSPGNYEWMAWGGPRQDLNNDMEAYISQSTVKDLEKIWSLKLSNNADNSILYIANVSVVDGSPKVDILLVYTNHSELYALNPSTGAYLWSTPPAGTCDVLQYGACYTTSTPAIGPNKVYLYAYSLDGKVHRYFIANGTESPGGGFPVQVSLKPAIEKQSSPLVISKAKNGHHYLYVAIAGLFYDSGDYQGRLVTVDLTDGSSKIWNTLCSDQGNVLFAESPAMPHCGNNFAGSWGRAGPLYYNVTDRVYFSTGNGLTDFDTNWGMTTIALNADGTGNGHLPADYYTPRNYDPETELDTDIGCVSALIVDMPPECAWKAILIQGGKDSLLRILDPLLLGHTGGEISTTVNPQGSQMLTAPALWTETDGTVWIFTTTWTGVTGFNILIDALGHPILVPRWTVTGFYSSPLMVRDVLFVASNDAIKALNPITGALLWSDSLATIHWQVPMVANGMLFVPDNRKGLTAWALPYNMRTPSPPTTAPPTTPSPLAITSSGFTSGPPALTSSSLSSSPSFPPVATSKAAIVATLSTTTGKIDATSSSGIASSAPTTSRLAMCLLLFALKLFV